MSDRKDARSPEGRNAPCPCGSGKKYKKCCLAKDEEKAPDFVPALESDALDDLYDADADGEEDDAELPPLHPYLAARYSEDPELHERPGAQKRPKARIKPEDVAALTTEEIVERLAKLDVATDPELFRAAAATRHDAWSITDDWKAGRTLKRTDEDFLGFAAVELWRRWLPERPSFETIDDWVQDGYVLVDEDDTRGACEAWFRSWDALRPRMNPDLTTTTQVDLEVFPGTQSMHSWITDFTQEAHKLATETPAETGRVTELLRQVLAQFTDEDEEILAATGALLADLLCRDGREPEAIDVLHDQIKKNPHAAVSYVALAALLKDKDRARATELLDTADAITFDATEKEVDLHRRALRESASGSTSAAVPATKDAREVLTVRVMLDGTIPPIWRRLEVDATTKLSRLHEILQAAMGWKNEHEHLFADGKSLYGVPVSGTTRVRDERRVEVGTLLRERGDALQYDYDEEEGWTHVIAFESREAAAEGVAVPRCLGGRRACPPESCGGVVGYGEILDILEDPDDEEFDEVAAEWGELRPEVFDLAEVNQRLEKVHAAK